MENPRFNLLINGEEAVSQDTFSVTAPITQEHIHLAPAASKEHALEAVEAAEAAFEHWRDSTPLERRTIMLKAADIIHNRSDELVQAMRLETGAKASWAAFNIKTCIQMIHEAAGMTTQVKGELVQSNSPGMSYPRFES
jgi:acyl-CoA reductase-like NAD-dependent aldehyde dehydrogenase